MPDFGSISCSIELGSTNTRLKEYGIVYSNKRVSSFVCVPHFGVEFSISMTSSSYVAPGLAVFVFIDGQYQANRNKTDLKVPANQRPPAPVTFRFRQKEEVQSDSRTLIGRSWSFAPVLPAPPHHDSDANEDFLNNLGTIEVVVLRCSGPGGSTGRLGQFTDVAAVPRSAAHVTEGQELGIGPAQLDGNGWDGDASTAFFDNAGKGTAWDDTEDADSKMRTRAASVARSNVSNTKISEQAEPPSAKLDWGIPKDNGKAEQSVSKNKPESEANAKTASNVSERRKREGAEIKSKEFDWNVPKKGAKSEQSRLKSKPEGKGKSTKSSRDATKHGSLKKRSPPVDKNLGEEHKTRRDIDVKHQSVLQSLTQPEKPCADIALSNPHWALWAAGKKGYGSRQTKSTDSPALPTDPHILPEYPQPRVDLRFVHSRGLYAQIKTGRGAKYYHNIGKPDYMDSMTDPHAVFTFRYRREDVLSTILRRHVVPDLEDEEVKLRTTSRAQLERDLALYKDRLHQMSLERHSQSAAGSAVSTTRSDDKSSHSKATTAKSSQKSVQDANDWQAAPDTYIKDQKDEGENKAGVAW